MAHALRVWSGERALSQERERISGDDRMWLSIRKPQEHNMQPVRCHVVDPENEQSGAYAWGGIAAIPVAVYGDVISPGRMLALEGLNGALDCSQQVVSGDCAEAAVGIGLAGTTTVAARNSEGFAHSLPESNLEWMHHAMSARMSDTYLDAVVQTTGQWSRGLGGAVGSAAESAVNWFS